MDVAYCTYSPFRYVSGKGKSRAVLTLPVPPQKKTKNKREDGGRVVACSVL